MQREAGIITDIPTYINLVGESLKTKYPKTIENDNSKYLKGAIFDNLVK